MNKLFTRIAGLTLGLAMAIGVGVAAGSKKETVSAHAATRTYNKVSSLTAGDEVLIVTKKDSTYYVLPAATTTSAPSANVTATVANDAITADLDSHLFTVGGSNDAWTFTNSSGDYLYTTSANNGVRIGSTNDSWKLISKTNGFAMQEKNNSRYLGVYNTQDWRSYTDSTHSNYGGEGGSGESISFFKKGEASQTYTVSFNGNGGTGDMNPVPEISGSYSLPANGFTAPSGKTFSGWKAENAGDLIPVGGSYNVSADVTFFAQWVDAYTVTYSAGTNGSGSYVHASQPTGTYTLLPFASLTGISANTGYRFANYTVGGIDKNPGDTITLNTAVTVTVNFEVKPLEATYDFVTNFGTYSVAAGSYEGTDWGGYSSRTITAAMVGADYDATISFTNVSKQGNTITDRPVIAAKYNTTSTMLFTLAASVSSTYTITTVDVEFAQWTTKKLNAALYKGTTVSGTPLDNFTSESNPRDLVTNNLNGDSFIVDFVSKDNSGTTNYQLGITSITIGLSVKATFGTVDHISVTSLPNTIYHVGEAYDSTGLTVTAYDGADEATANYKDVTNDASTGFTSGYVFADSDVPTVEMFVEYEEDDTVFAADSIVMHVYALAEYKLVTEAPADWSGNYLIIGTNADSDLCAFNGSLSMLDAESNYKVVTADENNTIQTGQELEWTISATAGGYSIQAHNGKYIGWASKDNNGLTASETALDNTLSYADGAVTIAGSGGRKLTFNNDSTANRFRYYQSGTVQLYKLVESDNADAFAQTFLSAFTCDNGGVNKPSFADKEPGVKWTWALLEAEYNKLTAAEKEQFRLGTPSESGTNIQKALARYDYVVGKYYVTELDKTLISSDFMSRTPSPIDSARLSNVDFDSNATISIIVISSMVVITALGVCLILRKRKEQR